MSSSSSAASSFEQFGVDGCGWFGGALVLKAKRLWFGGAGAGGGEGGGGFGEVVRGLGERGTDKQRKRATR